MSGGWKITIVGGSLNGMDFSFPADREVLIGRTRRADVSIPKTHEDVSAEHLRLSLRNGVPVAVNVSARSGSTFFRGAELAPAGGSVRVSVRDVVELGRDRSVAVRFDAVPSGGAASESDADAAPLTGETRWAEASQTMAPTAVVEETAVEPPENGAETFATRVSDTSATNALQQVPEGDPPPPEADDETVVSASVVEEEPFPTGGGETTTNGVDPESGSGETQEAHTFVVDPQVLADARRAMVVKSRNRRVAVAFGFAVAFGMLAALWFLSRPDGETDRMSFPLNAEGRRDVAKYSIKDDHGETMLVVDYPRDDGMSVSEAPDGGGVTVVSAMGRDRDVPFFLQLEAVSRPEELEMDLLSSVRSWMARAEESGLGYVFDARTRERLSYKFFEDEFPGCCEKKSLYGVKFVTFDYKRTWADGNNTLWHGVLTYFRRGDTAYIHRREIPESSWVRGGSHIKDDPNIAIYSTFIDSYWESPGPDGLPTDRPTHELMESVRGTLAKERANDWRYAKKEIDAILVKTWRTDPKTRDLAAGCLRQFREILRTYYWGKYNAFDTAKENRDEKRMARIRNDAAMVFDDPGERYYHLVGNGEVW